MNNFRQSFLKKWLSEYFKTKLTMRIFKTWSVLLILLLSIVYSCKNESEVDVPYFLKLETTGSNKVADTLYVEADGISQAFTVKSNGPWKIVSSKSKVEWVNLQPDSGNGNGSFKLSIDRNESIIPRETKLLGLVNDKEAVVLIIKQKNHSPELFVTPSSPVKLQSAGGVIEFAIKADVDWDYTYPPD